MSRSQGVRLALAVLAVCALATAAQAATPAKPDDKALERASVFRVRLRCSAAPELACGGGTKSMLLELERDPGIEQAWLNTSGTALLVVGSERSTPVSRAEVVRTAVGKLEKDVDELQGEARDKMLADFSSGSGWYRGESGADEQSRRAARVVAARLVRRTRGGAALSAAKAAELESAVFELLQVEFVRDPQGDPTPRLLKIGGAHLDRAGFLAFRKALAVGLNPRPGEK